MGLIRDTWEALRLRARYRRVVQERVLSLVEGAGPRPAAEDPGRWLLLGETKGAVDDAARVDLRGRARRLVVENPHARNLLRLMEAYVVGPGLQVEAKPACGCEDDEIATSAADRLWATFLEENRRHFSYGEYARRTWRDGECFLWMYARPAWPPTVRFVDPETIGATREEPESQGILTELEDVETPRAYLRVDPASGELAEVIDAAEMLHTKIGVDSNQKRGVTIFACLLDVLSDFDRWLDTEMLARKLQASIVLWRKVQGGPSQAAAVADGASLGSQACDPYGAVRKERFRPGTILTTSQGTELQYLQPNTNFGDAVPLGRLLLLCAAAGAGLPEFMLTSDASNGNFASTMVAEGPAVKLFQSEQEFFAGEFRLLWRWVMGEAVALGLLPGDFLERVQPHWTFPKLVTRDRPRERLADARLVEARILSRAEIARRDGVDPGEMRREIGEEAGSSIEHSERGADPFQIAN